MFANAKKPDITCSRREDKVVGYSFRGLTEVNGKSSYRYHSKAFDLSDYPEPEPPRDSAVGKLFRRVEGVLIKMMLNPS